MLDDEFLEGEDEEEEQANVADETGVRVMAQKCDTCIFRPGNLMQLRKGCVATMVKHCLENDAIIPCHDTLGEEKQAVCRGLYDRHADKIWPLRYAKGIGAIVEWEALTK